MVSLLHCMFLFVPFVYRCIWIIQSIHNRFKSFLLLVFFFLFVQLLESKSWLHATIEEKESSAFFVCDTRMNSLDSSKHIPTCKYRNFKRKKKKTKSIRKQFHCCYTFWWIGDMLGGRVCIICLVELCAIRIWLQNRTEDISSLHCSMSISIATYSNRKLRNSVE